MLASFEDDGDARVEGARASRVGPPVLLACAVLLSGCASGAAARASHDTAHVPRAAKKDIIPPWNNGDDATSIGAAPTPNAAGQRILATAQRMSDENRVVRGSCYDYVAAVFREAGHTGWRRRQQVYHRSRNGPYVSLDLIQPGDWLYLVNHPETNPVGTHSVIFIRWIDRTRGEAEVWNHPGGRAPVSGELRYYDVSRTYSIMRAIDP